MTAEGEAESFGPYAITLSPAETGAAAARFGLRAALRGGLIASNVAPLAAFVLIVAFATILALTGLISGRAGRATLLLAAALFLSQRLVTYWRIRQACIRGRAAIEATMGGLWSVRIDESGMTLESGDRSRRLDFSDCEEAEDAGGLIFFWPRGGAPIVLPARVLPEGEAASVVAHARRRIAGKRPL
jgi:hypothetical protein